MNKSQSRQPLPAPCIIDSGIIVNKEDMRRLLNDIGRVHYLHTLDGFIQSEGEGWIMEIFADATQATLVANHSLYLNLQSFDYLILDSDDQAQTCFELVQENRHLRLTPLSSPLQEDGRIVTWMLKPWKRWLPKFFLLNGMCNWMMIVLSDFLP